MFTKVTGKVGKVLHFACFGKQSAANCRAMNEVPNIFNYWDYRVFLKDYFKRKKQANPRYSLSVFSKKGKIGSRSFVSLIMDGKRNLGLTTVYKFGRALDLDERELRFFLGLVSFNQSKSESEKEELYNSLKEMRPLKAGTLLQDKQEEFYSDWRLPVIYTLLSGEQEGREIEWIQERIQPKLKLPDLKRLLAKLESLELVEAFATGWRASDSNLKSSDGRICYALRQFHREMIELGKAALQLPLDKREISGLTLKVDAESFARIKEQVREFRKNLIGIHTASKSNEAYVAQLNIQLFPVTHVSRKEEKK